VDASNSPDVYESRVFSRFAEAAHPFGFGVLSFKDLSGYLASSSFNSEKLKIIVSREATISKAKSKAPS
jgi:hypothetical protein